MRMLLPLLVLALPLLLRADESWPQFRGPNASGVSTARGVPTKWDEKTNIVWKTPIHDKGWSSPVVLGKQVWLTTARDDGKAQWAVCVDRASGKVVHDVKVFDTPKPPYFFMPTYNSHASPSPVIEPGRVYVHFGSSGTACLDTTTGKVIWSRRDLPCDHWRAPGSSPILWENLLILSFDGHDQQYLIALDKTTGKTVWKTERGWEYNTDDGDRKKAYSTPVIIEVNGKPQLVSPGAMWTAAYNPRTGKELWKVRFGGMNASAAPQFGHGLVFLATASPAVLLAVPPTGAGDVTDTVRWRSRKEAPQRPTPLLVGDLLFTVSDKGIALCYEAKTGKEVWSRRIFGNYSASPVYADGHIYCFDQEGRGHILTADRQGKLVATNRLADGCRATPAPVGKALFVRTLTHLYRIEAR